jgi:hypothetical protein
MDPAGLGAIIGVLILFAGISSFYVCDRRVAIYNRFFLKHKALEEEVRAEQVYLLRAPHSKIKSILPPLKTKPFQLKNLNSFQPNRQLLSTIPEEIKV